MHYVVRRCESTYTLNGQHVVKVWFQVHGALENHFGGNVEGIDNKMFKTEKGAQKFADTLNNAR